MKIQDLGNDGCDNSSKQRVPENFIMTKCIQEENSIKHLQNTLGT